MTPDIEVQFDKRLIEVFMAGRKSMQDEVEGRGRLIQRPITSQIAEAKSKLTKIIEQELRIEIQGN